MTHIRQRGKNFIIELVEQVQLRLPANIEALLMLDQLKPNKATSQQKPLLTKLISRFQNLVISTDDLEAEWNTLHLVQWPEDCLSNTVSFWAEVDSITDATGEKKFGNIAAFALALFSLPFSNATGGSTVFVDERYAHQGTKQPARSDGGGYPVDSLWTGKTERNVRHVPA